MCVHASDRLLHLHLLCPLVPEKPLSLEMKTRVAKQKAENKRNDGIVEQVKKLASILSYKAHGIQGKKNRMTRGKNGMSCAI